MMELVGILLLFPREGDVAERGICFGMYVRSLCDNGSWIESWNLAGGCFVCIPWMNLVPRFEQSLTSNHTSVEMLNTFFPSCCISFSSARKQKKKKKTAASENQLHIAINSSDLSHSLTLESKLAHHVASGGY